MRGEKKGKRKPEGNNGGAVIAESQAVSNGSIVGLWPGSAMPAECDFCVLNLSARNVPDRLPGGTPPGTPSTDTHGGGKVAPERATRGIRSLKQASPAGRFRALAPKPRLQWWRDRGAGPGDWSGRRRSRELCSSHGLLQREGLPGMKLKPARFRYGPKFGVLTR